MKRIVALTLILFFHLAVFSQIVNPVKWAFSSKVINNQYVDLIFKATISSPWHMYGLNIADGGPVPISISFNAVKGFEVIGKPAQFPKPAVVYDEIFEMKVELHNNKVTLTQRIKKAQSDSISISGLINYETCSDMQCVLNEDEFHFRLSGLEASDETAIVSKQSGMANSSSVMPDSIPDTANNKDSVAAIAGVTDNASSASPVNAGKSLWGLFFVSLLLGLGGLLTPCVYPMIPLTVSYFLRGNKTRSRAISEALVFGLSIVLIYTLIGAVVAVIKNPNAVNSVTTHWVTNVVFFLVFVILSASFFGMFEIILPAGLANKLDQQADKGGYLGAFFMALAMAVLSFSCTGPIVGSLLIQASQGEVLEPVIGMAGFSISFALPFTLFAIFPTWLKALPKSGGWLNTIKVFFAFIMLAFSLYFLAKIDQSYHIRIITRELFLSVWTVIFSLLGLYLIGKIRFLNDSPSDHIGVPRFFLSVISFSFALFLFTGLLDNPLNELAAILPPADRSKTAEMKSPSPISELCGMPKYSDFLSLPYNLEGYFDYNEALACAKKKDKPVFIDFAGHGCSNCKKMYAKVWSDPRVLKLLKEKFIIVALYTDDKTKLPDTEKFVSIADGKIKDSIGKQNQDLQITRFNSNSLPMYAIVDSNGNTISASNYAYDPSIENFIAWLEASIK